jgi:hypothetical protein
MNDNAPNKVAIVQKEQAHFIDILRNVVGLTDAQSNHIVDVGGVSVVDTLLEVQENDLLTCFERNNKPSLLSVSCLKGLMYWTHEPIDVFGDKCVVDIQRFTPEECKRSTRLCANASAKRSRDEYGISSKKDPSEPDKFHGKNKVLEI